ncbi:hypothetical protein J6590_038208 [Homalodisca vitripennis]|nr:hypothetical protein J6590_038208 [Homalodisca vitripennis]
MFIDSQKVLALPELESGSLTCWKDGFFIECGALDGETRSNTLYMERFLNWSGLLIEADPLNFAQMLRKNRHAWLSPTCLSKTPYPQIVYQATETAMIQPPSAYPSFPISLVQKVASKMWGSSIMHKPKVFSHTGGRDL